MAGIEKLAKFASKILSKTNKKNCGKLLKTFEDVNGQKIEVFQKKTGSRLLGNRRTVTTRFIEGADKPLEQTVLQKKGKILSTYTTKNDYDETTIFTQVNTKTGRKEASVNKWLTTTNDEGEEVLKNFRTKEVYRPAGKNKQTYVDNLDYSTGEWNRTTYQRFNNDEGRGIIKDGQIGYTKTFVDNDNIMHQQTALKRADESEALNWYDNPLYNLEGKEWKAPAPATNAAKMSGKRKAAIGIGLGLVGGTGLYIADVTTNKGTDVKPIQTDMEEVSATETEETTQEEVQKEETVTQTPAEEETQEQVEQAQQQEEQTEVQAEQEQEEVEEQQSEQEEQEPVKEQKQQVEEQQEQVQQQEQQQQDVEQTPSEDNLFGGTLNEISIKEYDVKPKDCLWNIAKRELQKANPGKTVTNAHILQQVKEFVRLNPQIKNPDLIYPNQKIKTAA